MIVPGTEVVYLENFRVRELVCPLNEINRRIAIVRWFVLYALQKSDFQSYHFFFLIFQELIKVSKIMEQFQCAPVVSSCRLESLALLLAVVRLGIPPVWSFGTSPILAISAVFCAFFPVFFGILFPSFLRVMTAIR